MNATSSIIRPETVAAKMAALKNLQAPKFRAAIAKEPRLADLAWFIQAQSMQAGGIGAFVADFLSLFSDSIGTDAMHATGKTEEPYTLAERQQVIHSFPSSDDENDPCFILNFFDDSMRGEMDWRADCRKRPDLSFVNSKNHAYFFDVCKRIAPFPVQKILTDFCTKPDAIIPDVWFFKDLPGALLEMLDAHAGRQSHEIVTTEVSRQVFDALEFAWTEKAMVEIIGDSRFGKTESVKAWCAMYPGRGRLVKTPCDNIDRSLLEAISPISTRRVSAASSVAPWSAKAICLPC
jgi:hypothetical protein